MKILKIIGIVIIAIILLVLLVALFIKKEYTVERKISINEPQDTVFNYARFLKNQDHFSKWAMMDPDMEKSYRGIDGTEGFVSAWNSKDKNLGKGEQEIKKITPNQRIDFELRFQEPFESTSMAYMTFEPDSSKGTIVTWGFNGKMHYPMNIMLAFMDMDKMIGNDLQTGLDNLKAVLEKK